jgi:hypothetical protein
LLLEEIKLFIQFHLGHFAFQFAVEMPPKKHRCKFFY